MATVITQSNLMVGDSDEFLSQIFTTFLNMLDSHSYTLKEKTVTRVVT